MQVRLHKKIRLAEEWNIAFFRVCVPWLTGLLLGAVAASYLSDSRLIIVRSLPLAKVSVIGVFLSSFLPFVIVVCVARFFGRRFLPYYLFLKAAALGLTFCYCAKCFGTAGWLLVPQLLFADLICSYCLLLFSFKLFTSKSDISKFVFFHYSGISVMFGMFHYFVLSPFTASLF